MNTNNTHSTQEVFASETLTDSVVVKLYRDGRLVLLSTESGSEHELKAIELTPEGATKLGDFLLLWMKRIRLLV